MKKMFAVFVALEIFCDKLNKNVRVDKDKCYFSGMSQDCECCGNHGEVKVNFDCECGGNHDLELSSW
jgi:hypothetical protein